MKSVWSGRHCSSAHIRNVMFIFSQHQDALQSGKGGQVFSYAVWKLHQQLISPINLTPVCKECLCAIPVGFSHFPFQNTKINNKTHVTYKFIKYPVNSCLTGGEPPGDMDENRHNVWSCIIILWLWDGKYLSVCSFGSFVDACLHVVMYINVCLIHKCTLCIVSPAFIYPFISSVPFRQYWGI